MKVILGALLWAFLTIGLTAGVHARNGLERFEQEIKPQFELKKFTYGSAKPLGDAGFVLENVEAIVPASEATGDKESTVRIDKVIVDDLDFDRLRKDTPDNLSPRYARLRLEGISGDDELFSALEPYGVPRVPVDLALDYRIDPAAKVLTVKKLEIDLRGQGRLELGLVMDGISDKTDLDGAKDDGRLRTASLAIDDKGLLSKLVPAMAEEEGMKPDDMINTALSTLAAFAAMQNGETLKALDAISSFVADWKAPKGPLDMGLKPAKTAGLDDFDKIMLPNALSTLFGFTATYSGTRPGAALAGDKKKQR